MKRAFQVAGLALLALLAVLLFRAARFQSKQLQVEPAPELALDADAIARRLAGGLRIPTISYHDRSRMDGGRFVALHAYLERSFPEVHAVLARETVNDWSLLYTWQGRDPSLEPVLLMGHLDTVPVEAGTEAGWEHPPFAGEVADGMVWGRGTIDDKGSVFCILEAVEHLVASGFTPRRTVLLAFGHDEEVGGDDGALAIAERLRDRGVRLELVLDEGGAVVRDVIPGVPVPLALVGIAEKGSVSLDLVVAGDGGHSSVPPRHTAIGVLASAIHRLEREPMQGSIDGTTRLMIDYLGPELGFPARLALANLWLSGPALRSLLGRDAVLGALTRTTTAATIVAGGTKSNVLPIEARAVVNHRIHPSDTWKDVVAHDRRVIDDERVQLEVGNQGVPRDPSAVAAVDSEAFRLLQRTIGEVFPEAVVVPNLLLGGTDARHFYIVSDNVYRLLPFVSSRETLKLVHGTNERIAVQSLVEGVRFYVRLLENASG